MLLDKWIRDLQARGNPTTDEKGLPLLPQAEMAGTHDAVVSAKPLMESSLDHVSARKSAGVAISLVASSSVLDTKLSAFLERCISCKQNRLHCK